ncbi:MAG: helix-turn-helix transcriptional regulator [Chloroflexi bacterium]|nr:helix-turn-helix transcriptional regulator [Chloroflexota bacterium]
MLERQILPSRLAAELGVSHTTIGRWIQGTDLPSTGSCRKIARYSGTPVARVLALAGHLPLEDIEETDRQVSVSLSR